MTRALSIAALIAGSLLASASAAQADPIVERTCFHWTDHPTCTPEVGNPVKPTCFHWTDHPTCVG